LIGICFAPSLQAKEKIRFKSPDGHFALRIRLPEKGGDETEMQIGIIDLRTKKTLLELEGRRGYVDDAKLVWSSDARRVAYYNPHHRGGETEVYFRDGSSFVAVELPEMPEMRFPRTPAPDENDKMITCEIQPVRWLPSGSLFISHLHEGLASGSAANDVIIGFDKNNRASVRKATRSHP
jgi:hypothetical protein